MGTIKGKVRTCFVFSRLIYEMMKNYRKLNDDKENNYKVCKSIADKVIAKAKIDFSVYGAENLPEENCLIISNHISFFDIVIFVAKFDKPAGFAYADNLLKLPILKKYINSIGGVPIHRDVKKIKESLSGIADYVKESSLILFPEGKCSYEVDRVGQFERGCFISLRSTDVPIVPVYIKVEELGKVARWVTPLGKIDIIIGRPFKPDPKMKSKQLAEYAYNTVVGLKDHL